MNKILDAVNFKEFDDRKRAILLPTKIVKSFGEVTKAEELLTKQDSQVVLNGKHKMCVLRSTKKNTAAVVVDFGKEIHGIVKIYIGKINGGNETAKMRIRLGESVMESITELGVKNAGNDHSARDTEFQIGWLSTHRTDESGFRFAYIELLTPDTEVEISGIEAIMIYRDLSYEGSFCCDSELLNTIYNTGAYTVHLNMQNYLWDGIKRDRLVWAGDMNTEILTALSVFGNQPVIMKSLDLVRDHTEIGEWMNTLSSYTLWWIIAQYNLYMWSGDIAYLKSQKEYMTETIKILCSYIDDDGYECLPGGRFFEHCSNNNAVAVKAAMQSLMCMTMEKALYLMSELGEKETEDMCKQAYEKMMSAAPLSCGNSVTAACLLVCSGICDGKSMCDKIIKNGVPEGFTSFMGYQCLEALAMSEEYEMAVEGICSFWGGMLKMGATTFWEEFNIKWMENASPITEFVTGGMVDIHGDCGDYCYKNFRHSLCHGWASAPTPWLAKYVLGINILEPGCKKVCISPHLPNLSFAKGTYPTPYGNIEVSHRKEDGKIITEYTAPEEIEVCLYYNEYKK